MTTVNQKRLIKDAQRCMCLLAMMTVPVMTHAMRYMDWDHVDNYAPAHFVYFDKHTRTYGCRVYDCYFENRCQGEATPTSVLEHADQLHRVRNNETTLVRCQLCDALFTGVNTAKQHQRQVHDIRQEHDKRKKASSDQSSTTSSHEGTCTVITKKKHPVCKQLEPHHSEAENRYPCPYHKCNVRFKRKTRIDAHINAEHTHETCYMCSGCNYWSYYRKNVEKHIENHTSSRSSHNNTDSHNQHTSQ